MSEPHVIRLRDPWECAPCAREDAVVWRRRFGRPSGLAEGERVWLCLRCTSGCVTVRLNDVEQSSSSRGDLSRLDVTSQLAPRNVLEVSADCTSGDRAFEAWLEITGP